MCFSRDIDTVPVLLPPSPLFDLPQPPVLLLADFLGLGRQSLFSPTKALTVLDLGPRSRRREWGRPRREKHLRSVGG